MNPALTATLLRLAECEDSLEFSWDALQRCREALDRGDARAAESCARELLEALAHASSAVAVLAPVDDPAVVSGDVHGS